MALLKGLLAVGAPLQCAVALQWVGGADDWCGFALVLAERVVVAIETSWPAGMGWEAV